MSAETMAKTIADAIARAGFLAHEITISDEIAMRLSDELAGQDPRRSSFDIYDEMKAGKARFMDVRIVVAAEQSTGL